MSYFDGDVGVELVQIFINVSCVVLFGAKFESSKKGIKSEKRSLNLKPHYQCQFQNVQGNHFSERCNF
jgi:hypothetical protein